MCPPDLWGVVLLLLLDTQILVLEWIRPDLEPENVFFYKNGQSHPERQHPSFRNRVELKDEHMEEGDLSLILKNVVISDTGTYECHVYQSERNHTMSIIDLKVDDSGELVKWILLCSSLITYLTPADSLLLLICRKRSWTKAPWNSCRFSSCAASCCWFLFLDPKNV
uniref:Ig-like domain-containing protein n=1 Tax=Anabas testudineus TaxID=64144 RepID=A0A7N6BTB6_ANATE